jgi:hypothetical protein
VCCRKWKAALPRRTPKGPAAKIQYRKGVLGPKGPLVSGHGQAEAGSRTRKAKQKKPGGIEFRRAMDWSRVRKISCRQEDGHRRHRPEEPAYCPAEPHRPEASARCHQPEEHRHQRQEQPAGQPLEAEQPPHRPAAQHPHQPAAPRHHPLEAQPPHLEQPVALQRHPPDGQAALAASRRETGCNPGRARPCR